MEMVGHTSIVYSVDAHSSGLIVSSSEDCFAKIWKGCFLYELCEILKIASTYGLVQLCTFWFVYVCNLIA